MLEWVDTGIEVAPPYAAPKRKRKPATPGTLALPVYPQQMTRIYTSDYDAFVIPSPNGNPEQQRILYAVSGTQGKIRHASIFEIPPGGSLLLAHAPRELSVTPGDNEIPGLAVQLRFLRIEVQRPGHGPEYQLRLHCVRPNNNDIWTLWLIYPDLPFWWRRYLPGQ